MQRSADGTREVVERVEVVLQQAGGAGQRLGDPALQHVLEQRQHLAPQPHPLQGRVVVVRVVPAVEARARAHAASVVARRTPSSGRR